MSSSFASVDDYEVFLSFRGPDTRQGFTDVLYEKMTTVEIRVFRDDDELAIGDKIESILQAIESSRICIPIFSPKFAESKWCLREVSKMVDLKKTIVPIFYKVSSDDVKLQRGSIYFDDFRKLEENHGDLEEVEKWKKALHEAATNKGRMVGEKSYTSFCKEIVEEILSKLGPRKRLLDIDYFVGDANKAAAMKLLQMESSSQEVVCVGIYGMGGMGKTTLTKLIYDEFSSLFNHCGFLPDIREFCKYKSIQDLPKYLCDNLEPKLVTTFHRSDQIPKIFKNKKVLLVLDDVDSYQQIKEIAMEPKWFGSGSRIILTTRDKKVVKDYFDESGSESRYLEMQELNREWGLDLFCKCAFREDIPPSPYAEFSKTIVAHSGGLPLTLTVVGTSLRNQDNVEIWKETIAKLTDCPHEEVKDKLMISYDSLLEEQKMIFLDMACLPKWLVQVSELHSMWQACSLFPHSSLQVLQSRCFVKIDANEVYYEMHDQLRDLGRDIVKSNSNGDIMQQSRLWKHKDIVEVLRSKQNKKLEILHHRYDYPRGEDNSMNIELSGFDNLRSLALESTYSSRIFGSLPKLRWLSLEGDPFLVGKLFLPNVEWLDLSDSDVDENWVGWKPMKGLKFLYLKGCKRFQRTPVFTPGISGLESLDMSGCGKLASIDSSIHKLQHLTYLNMSNCEKLGSIDSSIHKLQHLTYLNLSRCCSLTQLPEELGRVGNLTTLDLSWCYSLKIIQSIGDLHSLKKLNLKGTRITNLPDSIGRLERLEDLNLARCDFLVSLPETFGNLHSLKKLNLEGTRITNLPNSIGRLERLEDLNLARCEVLVSLPETFGNLHSLKKLDLKCTRITNLPDSIGRLERLENLNLAWCNLLVSLPETFGNLHSLKNLYLEGTRITNLPDFIGRLERLDLNLARCEVLESVERDLKILIWHGLKYL